jgi:tripartite-type tricarboxylate transporter receptor subunit TctC
MGAREEKKRCRRVCLFLMSVIGLGLLLGPTATESQEVKFPSKPVEIVVPYAPGGIMDIGSRILAEFLPQELKVPVVIRNQAGGGGMTAAAAYLSAKPDGYSILAGNAGSLIGTVQLTKNPPFDPRKDFLPLAYIADAPYVMSVPKTSPFKSFDEFVQFARSNPGKLKGGFAMLGTEAHFVFMSIIRDAKIEVKQVPFTGAGQINSALLGAHVDWIVQTVPASMPYIRSGDARALLVTRATPELPNVPTGADKGFPNVNLNLWLGFFVLPQIPKPVYDRLVSAIEATAKNPEVIKKLTSLGFTVEYKNPRGCSTLVEEQWQTIALTIKEMGIKVN